MRIVGVGDNTVDVYVHLGKAFPGGNAVNVPVFCRRLGNVAAYIGSFGNDWAGELLVEALAEEGVDTAHCRTLDMANAWSNIDVVDGDRVFVGADSGASGRISLSPGDLEFIAGFEIVHTSVYSHLEDRLPELKRHSAVLSFDFAQNWDEAYLARALPQVDIAFFSAASLDPGEVGPALARVRSQGPRLVVATQGANGAFAFDGERLVHQAAKPTTVTDTLGAGDAFIAAFLDVFARQRELPDAMAAGAVEAAKACRAFGAFGHGVYLRKEGRRAREGGGSL